MLVFIMKNQWFVIISITLAQLIGTFIIFNQIQNFQNMLSKWPIYIKLRYIRDIHKVTLSSSPYLWASFSLKRLFQWYPQSKEEIFIKSGYEILKLSIYCTRFETKHSSCTDKSSENICSSSGAVFSFLIFAMSKFWRVFEKQKRQNWSNLHKKKHNFSRSSQNCFFF